LRVTAIKSNKTDKRKISVYIDDEFSFSINADDFLSLNFYEAKEIDEEDLRNIKDTVEFNEAKIKAVRYLSLKLHSKKEVRNKLKLDGFKDGIIQKVLEELTSMGYVDDKVFAGKYICDRSKLKPVSRKLLVYELQSKGISKEIIEEEFSECGTNDAEAAEIITRKRFGKSDFSDEKTDKKIQAFLNYRGFSRDIINEIIEKLKNEISE
jgi:regulatory protein